MNNRAKGKLWEQRAEDYLISKGYRILRKNWTGRWSEIDLIAEKNDRLVFVEVKYRSNDKYGLAEEAITHKKRYSLRKSIYTYLAEHRIYLAHWDFDVICFNSNDIKSLRHYKSVSL